MAHSVKSSQLIHDVFVNDIPVTCVKLIPEIKNEPSLFENAGSVENLKVEENVSFQEGSTSTTPFKSIEKTGYETVNNWIERYIYAAEYDAVAIDCEWLAYWFRRQKIVDETSLTTTYIEEPEKICLLQLSTSQACLVINVKDIETLPSHLVTLLKSDKIRKVGVNVNGDATRIRRDFSIEVSNLHDLS